MYLIGMCGAYGMSSSRHMYPSAERSDSSCTTKEGERRFATKERERHSYNHDRKPATKPLKGVITLLFLLILSIRSKHAVECL